MAANSGTTYYKVLNVNNEALYISTIAMCGVCGRYLTIPVA